MFCFCFLFIITDEAQYKKLNYDEQYDKSTTKNQSSTKATLIVQSPQSAVSNKIAKRSNLKKRSDKNNFSHNWLLTTLKSHTGSVLDIR